MWCSLSLNVDLLYNNNYYGFVTKGIKNLIFRVNSCNHYEIKNKQTKTFFMQKQRTENLHSIILSIQCSVPMFFYR